YKRAHKTCDTVFPVRGRRVSSAVHLDTRCSGHAHDGCQAGCLIFWKDAWLRPVEGEKGGAPASEATRSPGIPICSEGTVCSKAREVGPDGVTSYVCQATKLPYATTRLDWWDVRQYIEDYTSGNVGLWRIFSGAVYATFYGLSRAGLGLGRPLRWCYDKFHP